LKIQQNLGISKERYLPIRERGTEIPSFQQVLQDKQVSLSENRLKTLLNRIEQQGDRLGRSRSLQDLMEYKQTIQSFLQEVVDNGVKLEEHRGYQPNGREKRLTIIKQVNSQLLDLSEQVLNEQAPSVDLLKKMGEIKGLLVNLYL
jgi:uncharacterized protein YaaR (DUF327 family)